MNAGNPTAAPSTISGTLGRIVTVLTPLIGSALIEGFKAFLGK